MRWQGNSLARECVGKRMHWQGYIFLQGNALARECVGKGIPCQGNALTRECIGKGMHWQRYMFERKCVGKGKRWQMEALGRELGRDLFACFSRLSCPISIIFFEYKREMPCHELYRNLVNPVPAAAAFSRWRIPAAACKSAP
jgi:hypothetical protein